MAVARDYAVKVEDKVEQRLASWWEIPAGVRLQNLVAGSAIMEHHRPASKQFEQKKAAQPEKKDVRRAQLPKIGQTDIEPG